MTEAYYWTTDYDAIASDGINITIGTNEVAFNEAGIEFGDMIAVIFWPDWARDGRYVPGGLDGPLSVPEALERAQTLLALGNYNRVIIAIPDRSLWSKEWGVLRDMEGLD